MKLFKKISFLICLILLFCFSSCYAAITEKQGDDVAEFAKQFIEIGNSRRDENGFPLLTYCLSGNWRTCIEIRTKGYTEQMYYVKNNGYYIRNGRYLELGDKWCMDCGTTVLYLLKKTLGLELLNSQGEPWHVQDIYNDALKGSKSQYFDMVYSGVSVGRIDYSKLQKGDVIAYITSHGNHGMLYLGDGYIAHANRDMIRSYGDNKISGFQVNKLNHYFLPGTVVRIMRIKDGIIPEDLVVNGTVTWPDNGETMDLLHREVELVEEPQNSLFSGDAVIEVALVEPQKEVPSVKEVAKNMIAKKFDTKNVAKPIFNEESPVYNGINIAVEFAKLQNDVNKARI